MALAFRCNTCGQVYESHRDSTGCPWCKRLRAPEIGPGCILREVISQEYRPECQLTDAVIYRLACGHTVTVHTSEPAATKQVECVRCELHAILRG